MPAPECSTMDGKQPNWPLRNLLGIIDLTGNMFKENGAASESEKGL